MTTARIQRTQDTQALFGLCSLLDMARRMSSSGSVINPGAGNSQVRIRATTSGLSDPEETMALATTDQISAPTSRPSNAPTAAITSPTSTDPAEPRYPAPSPSPWPTTSFTETPTPTGPFPTSAETDRVRHQAREAMADFLGGRARGDRLRGEHDHPHLPSLPGSGPGDGAR